MAYRIRQRRTLVARWRQSVGERGEAVVEVPAGEAPAKRHGGVMVEGFEGEQALLDGGAVQEPL